MSRYCGVYHPGDETVTCDRAPGHFGDHACYVAADQTISWKQQSDIIDIEQMSEADAADCFQPTPPTSLKSIAEIRDLGVQHAEEAKLYGDDQFLSEQRHNYDKHSKKDLIEELLRRDQNALREGRALGDGRAAGALLREFVRGILHAADQQELDQIVGAIDTRQLQVDQHEKPRTIDRILAALGADPASKRHLRLEGSTVGNVRGGTPGVDPETMARPDVAESIRERDNRAKDAGDER